MKIKYKRHTKVSRQTVFKIGIMGWFVDMLDGTNDHGLRKKKSLLDGEKND